MVASQEVMPVVEAEERSLTAATACLIMAELVDCIAGEREEETDPMVTTRNAPAEEGVEVIILNILAPSATTAETEITAVVAAGVAMPAPAVVGSAEVEVLEAALEEMAALVLAAAFALASIVIALQERAELLARLQALAPGWAERSSMTGAL